MPILIRELVIKARVEPEPARSAPAAPKEKGCGCDDTIGAEQLSRILADRQER